MADEDSNYAAATRRLPCAAIGMPGHRCDSPTEAHHAGSRLSAPVKGRDRRAHDHTIVPLCHLAHMAWHASSPPFRGMGKAGKRAWTDDQIDRTWERCKMHATMERNAQPS